MIAQSLDILLITQTIMLLALFAARAHWWLILALCLPTPHCLFSKTAPHSQAQAASLQGVLLRCRTLHLPCCNSGLQLVIISKVFMKHTWETQEAQPLSSSDCKDLVELIFSKDFASEGCAFLLLLLFSLRSKSLLWCSEKQAYSFRELDMYPSISRTNLSVIFLRKNITGQSNYSRGKMLDLKSAVHNFQN